MKRVKEEIKCGMSKFYPQHRKFYIWFYYKNNDGYSVKYKCLSDARKYLKEIKHIDEPTKVIYHSEIDYFSNPPME